IVDTFPPSGRSPHDQGVVPAFSWAASSGECNAVGERGLGAACGGGGRPTACPLPWSAGGAVEAPGSRAAGRAVAVATVKRPLRLEGRPSYPARGVRCWGWVEV